MLTRLHTLLLISIFAWSFMPQSTQAEEQIIEVQPTTSVRLFADYTFQDCCDLDSISAGTSLITVGTCGTMGGYCMAGKRVAVWNFELPVLPQDAVLLSAIFQGRHNGGSAPISYRGQWYPDSALTYTRAKSTYSSGVIVGTANSSGGVFSATLPMEIVNGQWIDSHLVLTGYNSSDISLYNYGTLAPKIRLVIEVPDELCVGDMNDDGSVDTNDVLHVIGNWNDPYSVEDVMMVLERWGDDCDTSGD